MAAGIKRRRNSLDMQFDRFVCLISLLAITMATGIFLVGWASHRFANDALQPLVAGFLVVIVANIPQGLPATIRSQLLILERRLANKNIVLKKLGVIETLGATTVIATDKTGTLTTNDMTVRYLWCNNQFVSCKLLERSQLQLWFGIEGFTCFRYVIVVVVIVTLSNSSPFVFFYKYMQSIMLTETKVRNGVG
jgi:P-type E1-E2 ATPase